MAHVTTPIELRPERALDPLPRLVAGPEIVAERFDDVIGRHADVRRAGLEHLRDGVQHAGDGAERRIALAETADAVEVAKELVRAVDQMNDHRVTGV
jgi:hypothetical protein